MALVTETGQAAYNAESYCSVAAADAHHTAMGNTAWAALTEANKEIHLRRATRYMMQFYRGRWLGFRYTTEQALDWPRGNAARQDTAGGKYGLPSYYAVDSVPAEVVEACAVLALKSSGGTELAPDLEAPIMSETVGPITTVYGQNARQTTAYYAVDLLLKLLLRSANTVQVARA